MKVGRANHGKAFSMASGVTTGTLTSLRSFTLRTFHGTSIGFAGQDVARLVHGSVLEREAVLVELPHGVHLLIDIIQVIGSGFRESSVMIPLRLETEGSNSELVNLRRPLEQRYLSAHANVSTVSIDRLSPSGWEQFGLIRNLNASVLPLLTRLHGVTVSCASFAEMVISLASVNCRLSWAMAAASLHFATPEMLKPLVKELSGLPSYELVFPALRSRLSEGRERFEYQVNHRLATEIRRFHWSIGDHSYGTPHIFEPHLGKLTIGKYCSMNDFVIILGNHATDLASSYPFGELARYWPTSLVTDALVDHVAKDVVIGNDVWIGNGALLLPGTVVGDGAVIGARAVARGTIPPYAVVVGNPGKVIRRRFDAERIKKLLALAWWNWPDHKVDRFIPYILDNNIDRFLELAGSLSEPINESATSTIS